MGCVPWLYGGEKIMNREDYLKFHREVLEKLHDITKQKIMDYSGAFDSPFDNFTNVERLGVASTEIGYLTRMCDKFTRIHTIIKTGQAHVKDETVEDTLLDLANYCISLAGYLRSKK